MVDSQFGQSRQIFLKALETSENPERLESSEEKYQLKQVLNEYELDLGARFVQPSSVRPMYNLVQYYMNNEPHERLKILFWLRTLLQLAQLTSAVTVFDECYATLCILNNERVQLNEFLRVVLREKYEDEFAGVYFGRLLAVLVLEKDREEADRLGERAGQL